MFFIFFFGVGIGDEHPKVDFLSRFFSKQQKNGNLLLGIVEKWWHFFENENFFSFLCGFYEKSGMVQQHIPVLLLLFFKGGTLT
jgi:hypothetical protein